MTIDVKSYKEKVLNRKPAINLVPLIDILFTIMIFLVVTSNFSATDMSADDASSTDSGTGKPNVTDVSGDAEYYIMPVANLHKVVVDGKESKGEVVNWHGSYNMLIREKKGFINSRWIGVCPSLFV